TQTADAKFVKNVVFPLNAPSRVSTNTDAIVENNETMENRVMPAPAKFNFYTTREAANKLGVSVTTIQLWVESGILSAWKTAGGHRRVPREAIDAMLAGQQSAVAEEQAHHAHSVVIVEDEPVQREMYRIKFAEWKLPANLYLAADGFEGLVMAGKY